MAHAERVPVKISGVVVGTARVDDDGTIEITLNSPKDPSSDLLHYIRLGLITGLSLAPIVKKADEENPRDSQQRLGEYGGLRHSKNDGHNYTS